MANARKSFIRSLAAPKPVPSPVERERDCEPSSSSQPRVEGSRKRFFASLRSEEVVRPQPPAEKNAECTSSENFAVKFSLEGLLAFQNTALGIQNTKSATERKALPRKRPNYNNSKRKLLAQVSSRQKFLECVLFGWMSFE